MKKLFLILPLLIIFISPVKADTNYEILPQDFYSVSSFGGGGSNAPYYYTNFNEFINDTNNKEIFDELYNNIMENYDNYKEQYPYYVIGVNIISSSNSNLDLNYVAIYMECSNESKILNFYQSSTENTGKKIVAFYYNETYYKNFIYDSSIYGGGQIPNDIKQETGLSINVPLSDPSFIPLYRGYNTGWIPVNAFQTNIKNEYHWSNWIGNNGTINIKNSNNETIENYSGLDNVPFLYTEENPYNPEDTGNYTTVNLDNYEYVLLTLKNYNQNQAFSTSLQVKGQIGITPIYNYGQTSKDTITGVQVQDRCNVSYENYTAYPFYILQQDIQNNVVYAVKECSEGSSFKFDNTIFDITYITQENKDNPQVTINGKTYDVIPYDDLPSTATKNEENNYIPGESGSATDTGGLDSAIKNAQQKMSEIWNTFTYFTDFINQIFSVFPEEVRVILLSAFTIMIVIGIIKIFIN